MDFLTRATRLAKQVAPTVLVAAAAGLSLGAYQGYAAQTATHHRPRRSFTLTANRKAVTLAPGSSARLTITIHRHGLTARVGFRLAARLASGLSARFSPARTRRKTSRLTIRVSTRMAAGRYRVRLRAAAGRLRRTMTVTVTVMRPTAGASTTGQVPPFSITGNPTNLLEPGAPRSIDVVVTNPNSDPLTLTQLVVHADGITAPQATAELPCGLTDFIVQQYSGAMPLTIPANTSRSLSELGVPPSEWPELSLVDLPRDQDGCQGASLRLTYAADARLG